MTRSRQGWLGLLTALPLAGFVLCAFMVAHLAHRLQAQGSFFDLLAPAVSAEQQGERVRDFGHLALVYGVLSVLIAMGSAMLSGGLSVFYARHALRNERLDPSMRRTWAVSLVLVGHVFLMLFYWWRYLRPPTTESPR